MSNYYKVAGLTFRMKSFGTTEKRAERYRIAPTEKIDFELISPWEKIKDQHPNTTDDVGEYLCTGTQFYRHLLDHNGMMLHSSAVVVEGRAYLFSAPCGTGKSTHTALWLRKFGDKAFILNDDKPALRLENGVWYAYGTPWSGKHDISEDLRIPVAGIAMIRRGATNEICPMGGLEAVRQIFRQVNRPRGMAARGKVLELLDRLITMIPIWDLACNMDLEAADVAYEAMKRGVK